MPDQFRNNKEYLAAFSGDSEKKAKALKHALETRKFEIELYWKRATYFWTFIAAALAAYGVIRASKDIELVEKVHLSVLVGVLGFVFSFAWYAVNRGSKKWQENWEDHVAVLEDDLIGPLFKTISDRPKGKGIARILIGPYDFSVSKINQFVSAFVMCVWLLLIWSALPPFNPDAGLDWFLVAAIGLGAVAYYAMLKWGRSDPHDHDFTMTRYSSRIIENGEDEA